MEITIYLSEILKQKGLSQRELSRETNIRLASINEMCRNETVRLPLDNLAKICCTLQCDISDLLKLTCVNKEGDERT